MRKEMKTINLSSTADSRLVVFSDAHRGDGTGADDFAANSLIFKCALDYYLAAGFTLIELGIIRDRALLFGPSQVFCRGRTMI